MFLIFLFFQERQSPIKVTLEKHMFIRRRWESNKLEQSFIFVLQSMPGKDRWAELACNAKLWFGDLNCTTTVHEDLDHASGSFCWQGCELNRKGWTCCIHVFTIRMLYTCLHFLAVATVVALVAGMLPVRTSKSFVCLFISMVLKWTGLRSWCRKTWLCGSPGEPQHWLHLAKPVEESEAYLFVKMHRIRCRWGEGMWQAFLWNVRAVLCITGRGHPFRKSCLHCRITGLHSAPMAAILWFVMTLHMVTIWG